MIFIDGAGGHGIPGKGGCRHSDGGGGCGSAATRVGRTETSSVECQQEEVGARHSVYAVRPVAMWWGWGDLRLLRVAASYSTIVL